MAMVLAGSLSARAFSPEPDLTLRLAASFDSAETALEPVNWLLAQAAPARGVPANAVPAVAPMPVVKVPEVSPASVERFSLVDNFNAIDWRLVPPRIGGAATLEYLNGRGTLAGDKSRLVESVSVTAASYIWQPWFAQVRGNLTVLAAQESGTAANSSVDRASAPRSTSLNGGGSLSLFPASRFPFSATLDSIDSRSSGEYASSDYRNTRLGLLQSWRSPLGEESLNAALDASRLSSAQFGQDSVVSLTGGYLRQFLFSTLDTQLFASRNRRQDQGSDLLRATARYSWRPDSLITSENMLSMNFSRQENGGGGAIDSNTRFLQANSFSTWRPDEDSPLFVTGNARLTDFNVDAGPDALAIRTATVAANASYKLTEQLSLTAGLSANVASTSSDTTLVLAETAGANYSSEEIKLGRAVYSWSAAASGGNQSGGKEMSRFFAETHANHQISQRFAPMQSVNVTASYSQGAGILRDPLVGTGRTLFHNLALYCEFQPVSGQQLYVGGNAADSRTTGTLENRIRLANLQFSGQAQVMNNGYLSSSLTVQRIQQTDSPASGRKDTTQRSGSITFTKMRLFDVRMLRYQLTAQFNDLQLESRLFGDVSAPRDDVARLIEQRIDYQIGLLNVRLGMRHAVTNNRGDNQFFLRINRQFGDY